MRQMVQMEQRLINSDMEINDYMTSVQLERARRQNEICEAYRSLAAEEGMKPYRAMRVVASRYNMTTPGVSHIVIAAGLYTPKTRKGAEL